MAATSWLDAAAAGAILRRARERLSLTQDQVAEVLGVDKSYISKLEGGLHHAGRSKYFPQLVAVLRLGPDEIRQLNPGAVIEAPRSGAASPGRRGPPLPPVVEPLDLPLQVPAELEQVIGEYGHRYPELRSEATVRALCAPRLFAGQGHGPQTSEEWLEYFLMNRRWLPR